MKIYIFTRNKKSGKKRIIDAVNNEDEARKICMSQNSKSKNKDWYEFTRERSYAEN